MTLPSRNKNRTEKTKIHNRINLTGEQKLVIAADYKLTLVSHLTLFLHLCPPVKFLSPGLLIALQQAQLVCRAPCCAAWSGRAALHRFLRRQTFWCWWGQRLQPAPHTWPPQGRQVRSCDNPVHIDAYVCPLLEPESWKLCACFQACVGFHVEFFAAMLSLPPDG